jgi:hypothetical protein
VSDPGPVDVSQTITSVQSTTERRDSRQSRLLIGARWGVLPRSVLTQWWTVVTEPYKFASSRFPPPGLGERGIPPPFSPTLAPSGAPASFLPSDEIASNPIEPSGAASEQPLDVDERRSHRVVRPTRQVVRHGSDATEDLVEGGCEGPELGRADHPRCLAAPRIDTRRLLRSGRRRPPRQGTGMDAGGCSARG